jgi:aminopeptidase N
VASLLRGFSAPVHLDFEQTDAELAHLMAHDSDPFNRWEAGQRLATRVLLAGIAVAGAGTDWIPAKPGRRLSAGCSTTGSPATRRSPPKRWCCRPNRCWPRRSAGRGGVIDPEAIHLARLNLRRHLATELRANSRPPGRRWRRPSPTRRTAPRSAAAPCATPASPTSPSEPDAQSAVLPRLLAQLTSAGNMTDVIAALGILANLDLPERETALAAFHAKWKDEALVVDKWLQVQATSRLPGTGARVRALMQHPAFDMKNPNKVYALVRAFCGANPRHFHAPTASGYRLAADVIIELQAMNPQVASRIARSFDRWRSSTPAARPCPCRAGTHPGLPAGFVTGEATSPRWSATR